MMILSSHRYDDDVKGKVVINTIDNIRPYNWVKMGMMREMYDVTR